MISLYVLYVQEVLKHFIQSVTIWNKFLDIHRIKDRYKKHGMNQGVWWLKSPWLDHSNYRFCFNFDWKPLAGQCTDLNLDEEGTVLVVWEIMKPFGRKSEKSRIVCSWSPLFLSKSHDFSIRWVFIKWCALDDLYFVKS